MFMHLFRLIWNRKLSNLLIIAELTLAFLVLFFITASASHLWKLYNRPLGFEWQDRYSIMVNPGSSEAANDMGLVDNVMNAIEQRADVDWIHIVSMPPFRGWNWTSDFRYEGKSVDSMVNSMSDGAPEALGIELKTGRWFNEGDAAQVYHPVLINQKLVDELFPDGVDPIGANINPPREERPEDDPTEYRVIGTFEDFRQTGEFSENVYYTIGRFDTNKEDRFPNSFVIKPADGISAELEESLLQDIKAMARDWDVEITPLSTLRDRRMTQLLTPLMVGSIIAGFLLLMVAFGLFGVLWQNVTRRTHELGLRRALGASAGNIFGQITIEMMLIAALAISVGILIAVQFPLLGTFSTLNWSATVSGIIASTVLLLILVTICTLYPGWMASSKLPAEALRYE